MKKDIAEKWVAALRGGEYKQAKEWMREFDEQGNVCAFCCLGVLTDIILPEEEKKHNAMWCNYARDEILNEIVAERCGINVSESKTMANYLLPEMNDNGVSFSEIADYIEQHWESI